MYTSLSSKAHGKKWGDGGGGTYIYFPPWSCIKIDDDHSGNHTTQEKHGNSGEDVLLPRDLAGKERQDEVANQSLGASLVGVWNGWGWNCFFFGLRPELKVTDLR